MIFQLTTGAMWDEMTLLLFGQFILEKVAFREAAFFLSSGAANHLRLMCELTQQNAVTRNDHVLSALADPTTGTVKKDLTKSAAPWLASPIATGRGTMSYTLSEAAAACGINKSTVLRAVKSGRISGTKDDLGTWHVEAAELHRIFPPAASADARDEAMPRHAAPDAVAMASMADALVAELRAVIADLRREKDHWQQAHERASETLANLAQRQLPAPGEQPKRRWWRRA